MEAKEYREMSGNELLRKRQELKEQIFHLRIRRATGQMEHPMNLRQARRDLARLETILKEGGIRQAAEKTG